MILIKIQTLAGDAALGFVEALGFINAKIFLEFKLIDFIAKRRLELQIPYNSGSFMVNKRVVAWWRNMPSIVGLKFHSS